jgi:beta-galactosidase
MRPDYPKHRASGSPETAKFLPKTGVARLLYSANSIVIETTLHRAMKPPHILLALALLFASTLFGANETAELPPGVKAVWDLDKAHREMTPTLERVRLNGLWKWQPAGEAKSENVPDANWGWFKVPGAWPGVTDYMQKDSQTLYRHATWVDANLGAVTAAWQEREFTVPENWKGRRIALQAEYLNSFATVFVDGNKAGEMRFPAGEVDITAHCQPGRTHKLTMLVLALPLKAVLQSYTDSASARTVKGTVARRGTCGDIFLVGTVAGPRISEAKVDTFVRAGRILFRVNVTNHLSGSLRARVRVTAADGEVMEATGTAMQGGATGVMGVGFGKRWKPKQLWDIHTPTNQCEAVFSLIDESERVVDQALPMKFGFREFSIEGRDFYLNGSRIFLSAVPLDNAEVGAAWATYAAAKESLERLKSFGINFVYTHNYGCEPGSHLSFSEILKAADDVGMLVALSQPHFSHYDWKTAKPTDKEEPPAEGYTEHARFYTRVAGSHPSVVLYSMSHNGTGYSEDMNPFMIDGVQAPRDQWAERNAAKALRAENVVRALDFSRPVYHHASGNLGAIHNMNFYPNFVPIQELSDWFGHWSTNGVKPAFMCEYGAPFTWDWTMYRGWYKGEREFGSAKVPWENLHRGMECAVCRRGCL